MKVAIKETSDANLLLLEKWEKYSDELKASLAEEKIQLLREF
jgi:hypothetical protein